ncbi:hypothetical protein EJ08DRAFT_501239 [Tothia fuscella]|uniref:Uncharacterized protein n=1 Tax=Tothia fuscella TaxID=1048955 RepID=A0A9P4NXQ0_9PEZI|nr:hypothetical protein EJ08DRAFT_501239 [Tothia fuscella]
MQLRSSIVLPFFHQLSRTELLVSPCVSARGTLQTKISRTSHPRTDPIFHGRFVCSTRLSESGVSSMHYSANLPEPDKHMPKMVRWLMHMQPYCRPRIKSSTINHVSRCLGYAGGYSCRSYSTYDCYFRGLLSRIRDLRLTLHFCTGEILSGCVVCLVLRCHVFALL